MENLNVVIVEDYPHIRRSLENFLKSKSANFIRNIKFFATPGEPSDLENSSLFQYLREKKNSKDFPHVVIIDLHFGNEPSKKKLGIDAIELFHRGFPELGLVVITNYDTKSYFQESYLAGARVFIHKKRLETYIIPAIAAAIDGDNFFPGFEDWKPESNPREELIIEQVFKNVAKGFSNSCLIADGYTSVAVQKATIKDDSGYPRISNKDSISGHRIPGENQWNDVWFLLKKLEMGDKEIIDYVEKLTGIEIHVRKR